MKYFKKWFKSLKKLGKMAIKNLEASGGIGGVISFECDTQVEADLIAPQIDVGGLIKIKSGLATKTSTRGSLESVGGEATFSVDGYSFDKANIAVVDGDSGDDATAVVGSGAFKTVGAAAIAAKAVYDANPVIKVCVYVKAAMSIYTLGTNGVECFPNIHYYYEPKAITTSNNGFCDFTNLRGDYYIHGKGEHYTNPGSFNMMAWSRGSRVFFDADTVHNINTLQDYVALPYSRVYMECNVDKILTAGNPQGDGNDIGGGRISFNECDFLGGIAITNVWHDKQTFRFNKCSFRMNSPVFNPIDGSYTAYYKDGSVALVIDMVNDGNGAPRNSRLADLAGAANLQAIVDQQPAANVRTAVIDILVSSVGRGTNFKFIDCDFYIDAGRGIGFKVGQLSDCYSYAGIEMIRPSFIDESGEADTAAIVAWKDSTVTTEMPITIEAPVYTTDNYRVSHTDVGSTKPDITIL